MKSIVFVLPGNEAFARSFIQNLKDQPGSPEPEIGRYALRKFPDGETYLKVETPLKRRPVILICSLDRPDEKILPLLFFARTLKSLGAPQVGLVAPYLAYMRQDKRFSPGESVSADYFAALLSQYFDWLVTVDPHLHRHHSLMEIYSIPTKIVHAAPSISSFIAQSVKKPLVVGPDSESEQWVSKVALAAGAPYIVLNKKRLGDDKVKISLPDMKLWRGYTLVLVDDIVSTGKTLITATRELSKAGMSRPVCVCVHGIFAGNAYRNLQKAGIRKIVTSNSISGSAGQIDVGKPLAEAAFQMQDFCETPW